MPAQGPADAPVTLIEFGDFRCGYCRSMLPVLAQLRAHFGDDLRLVYLHFPIVSPDSGRAAVAAVAAARQDRFWEMHDALFAMQGQPLTESAVMAAAEQIGLDTKRFAADLRDPANQAVVQADAATARQLGLRVTPAFFVNGSPYPGVQPYAVLERAIEDALARAAP